MKDDFDDCGLLRLYGACDFYYVFARGRPAELSQLRPWPGDMKTSTECNSKWRQTLFYSSLPALRTEIYILFINEPVMMIVIIHHVHYRHPGSVGSILLCKKAVSRAAYRAVCVGVRVEESVRLTLLNDWPICGLHSCFRPSLPIRRVEKERCLE